MEQKQKNLRTLLLFVLATLAVIVVIAVFFIGNFRQNQRDAIVLPDTAQSAQPTQPAATQLPSLLSVDRSNVQRIVRSLARPEYYHQSYTITRQMGGTGAQTTAELWISENLLHARVQSEAGEKHLLSDGKTLYLWYAEDQKVRTLRAADGISLDELIGLPTYEQLGALSAASITDGAFVTDEVSGAQQIFAAAQDGAIRREYWIGLDCGLLTTSRLYLADETIYELNQTSLELLAAGDEAFDNVFLLPDGSAPFAAH